MDFRSGGNGPDFDVRISSSGGSVSVAGQGNLSMECAVMSVPKINIGSVSLLSFQIHGTKNGTSTAAGVLIGPNYDFTSTNQTLFYCVPCNVQFMRATLMFDTDTSSSGTMNLNFYRKASNTASPGLVHSMGVSYVTNSSVSYSQQFDINTGSALTYNQGEIFSVDYSNSPGNEWGIVFHGFQY
jgi:hypothetical protein